MSDCDVEIMGRDSEEHYTGVAQELKSAQHSLQQLKAEVAAVVEQLISTDSSKPLSSICEAIKRLQLSLCILEKILTSNGKMIFLIHQFKLYMEGLL